MESYIVHIYRRQKTSPYQMVGVIEESESNEKKPFHTAGELLGFFIGDGHTDLLALTEKRSANRLDLRLPVKVSGVEVDGHKFSEESVLENIGTNGASFSLKAKLKSGSELNLVIDPTRSKVKKKAKVIRMSRKTNSKKQIGVSFSE
jgi:hypothetical protein